MSSDRSVILRNIGWDAQTTVAGYLISVYRSTYYWDFAKITNWSRGYQRSSWIYLNMSAQQLSDGRSGDRTNAQIIQSGECRMLLRDK